MAREFILLISDELRPYVNVLDLGLQALMIKMQNPFFHWPSTPMSYKPHFARIILSPRSEALLAKLTTLQQGLVKDEKDIILAALALAKEERETTKNYYQSF